MGAGTCAHPLPDLWATASAGAGCVLTPPATPLRVYKVHAVDHLKERGTVSDKVLSMAEAIRLYVPDGSSVAMGLALEPLIPFAAGHEIIRQRKRNLTL